MIGKVRFSNHMQTRNIAHQVIVHPQSAHGVMHRGINPHRRFVGVLSSDVLVDVEEISVTLANCVFAQTRYGIGKIKINTAATGADTTTFVAHFLGGA